jgi:hypothetical protein
MEEKNYNSFYTGLFMVLLSNGVVVYGVVSLNWSFFMVIYSYWFGEVISSAFDVVKLRTLKRRNELPYIENEKQEKQGRFFFLLVYWVFIVMIVGFITAPSNSFGENIRVIFFMNKIFNINILCVLLGEMAIYWSSFHARRNYDPKKVVAKNGMVNKKTLIMHISIIFGTFVWFAMNSDKFFFHIDAGEYGNYGFIMVFVVVRLIGDLAGLRAEFSGK